MNKQFEMYKRRIVHVLRYFDESDDLPWDFVQRSGDGRFEAIACHLLDYIDGKDEEGNAGRVIEHSCGVFDDCESALKALHWHLRQIELADPWSWDFNRPTVN